MTDNHTTARVTADLTSWIRQHIGATLWDLTKATDTILASWTLTENGSGLLNSRNRIGWALLAAGPTPYPTAEEAATALLLQFTIAARAITA